MSWFAQRAFPSLLGGRWAEGMVEVEVDPERD